MATEQALESEVARFAERRVGRRNAHDIEETLALVTDDITWEDSSIDGAARGLLDARRYIESLFRAFSDISWGMPASLLVNALEFARRVGLMPARGSGTERMLVRLQRLQARFARP